MADYKPNDEDGEGLERDEKELEKEEDESGQDEPGKYAPISVADRKPGGIRPAKKPAKRSS